MNTNTILKIIAIIGTVLTGISEIIREVNKQENKSNNRRRRNKIND